MLKRHKKEYFAAKLRSYLRSNPTATCIWIVHKVVYNMLKGLHYVICYSSDSNRRRGANRGGGGCPCSTFINRRG